MSVRRLNADKENYPPGCTPEIHPFNLCSEKSEKSTVEADLETHLYDQCSWQPVQSSGLINPNLDALHVPDHQTEIAPFDQCSGQPVQSSGLIYTMLDAVARNNDDGTLSGSADDHSSVHKVSRKRGRNVPLWSRMKRKLVRQHGQTYSTAGGRIVAAKKQLKATTWL